MQPFPQAPQIRPQFNYMLPAVRHRYDAVLCAEMCSNRVGKCYRCSKPLKGGESIKAEICSCCAPSKRLKCTKCKRSIITQHFSSRVCNACLSAKGDKCVNCNQPFERTVVRLPMPKKEEKEEKVEKQEKEEKEEKVEKANS